MQIKLILAVFAFLGSIDIPGLFVVIVIFSVPVFFFVRRTYRRKFGDDKNKVITWSIATSLLLSTVLVVGLIAGLVIWSIAVERM